MLRLAYDGHRFVLPDLSESETIFFYVVILLTPCDVRDFVASALSLFKGLFNRVQFKYFLRVVCLLRFFAPAS